MLLVEKLLKWKNQLIKSLRRTDICKSCFKDIEIETVHFFLIGEQKICNKCFYSMRPYFKNFKFYGVNALALFPYNEKLKQMIYLLKGCKDYEMRECLFKMFRIELKIKYRNYYIVCAPSYATKDKERGFNHVEAIFSQLNLPILNILEKNKDVNQHNLNFHKRKNIDEVIKLKDDFSSIDGKKILLVDDIMTTGGTMKRCLELVKSQRPKKIKILVLAKRELSKEEKEVYKKEALDYI